MITPSNINAHISTQAKVAVPTNDRQQVSFMDLLALDNRARDLTVDNTEAWKSNQNENHPDAVLPSSSPGDEVINLFAGMQLIHPLIKQSQETNSSVDYVIPNSTDALVSITLLKEILTGQQTVEKRLASIIDSYVIDQTESPSLGFPSGQARGEKIIAPTDNERWRAQLIIGAQQSLDAQFNAKPAQIISTDIESAKGNITLSQSANVFPSITIDSFQFDNLDTPVNHITWKLDAPQVAHPVVQQDSSLPLATFTFGLSSQQSVKISSSVDLKWYATGKLSEVTNISQIKNTTNPSMHIAVNELSPDGYSNYATSLQSSTQISARLIALSEPGSNRSQNRSLLGGEKIPSQNLVSTAIALSFPELPKRKLTVVENNGAIDVVVRDYALSEDEKKSLGAFLTHYFKSVGKMVHSLTFNGKLYS